MKLIDTMTRMNSDNYKDRFKAEYEQLKIRMTKLKNIIDKYEEGTLDFQPSCDIDTLKAQYSVMCSYLIILEIRADIEEITL